MAVAACIGCGDSAPAVSSSNEEATVSGTIKLEGNPVTKGEVTFDPSSNVRKDAMTRNAAIGKDGTYKVTTLVGRNQVRFSGISAKRNVSFEEKSYEVKPGSSTFDVDLTPTVPRYHR